MEELGNRLKETERKMENLKEAHEVHHYKYSQPHVVLIVYILGNTFSMN